MAYVRKKYSKYWHKVKLAITATDEVNLNVDIYKTLDGHVFYLKDIGGLAQSFNQIPTEQNPDAATSPEFLCPCCHGGNCRERL